MKKQNNQRMYFYRCVGIEYVGIGKEKKRKRNLKKCSCSQKPLDWKQEQGMLKEKGFRVLLRSHVPSGLAGCCSFPPSPPVKAGPRRWLWFADSI